MVVNFRIRRISRSVCKLTRTPTHIDKKKKKILLINGARCQGLWHYGDTRSVRARKASPEKTDYCMTGNTVFFFFCYCDLDPSKFGI
jgi:hypothetical protein